LRLGKVNARYATFEQAHSVLTTIYGERSSKKAGIYLSEDAAEFEQALRVDKASIIKLETKDSYVRIFGETAANAALASPNRSQAVKATLTSHLKEKEAAQEHAESPESYAQGVIRFQKLHKERFLTRLLEAQRKFVVAHTPQTAATNIPAVYRFEEETAWGLKMRFQWLKNQLKQYGPLILDSEALEAFDMGKTISLLEQWEACKGIAENHVWWGSEWMLEWAKAAYSEILARTGRSAHKRFVAIRRKLIGGVSKLPKEVAAKFDKETLARLEMDRREQAEKAAGFVSESGYAFLQYCPVTEILSYEEEMARKPLSKKETENPRTTRKKKKVEYVATWESRPTTFFELKKEQFTKPWVSYDKDTRGLGYLPWDLAEHQYAEGDLRLWKREPESVEWGEADNVRKAIEVPEALLTKGCDY
jgi:hypothetical protein